MVMTVVVMTGFVSGGDRDLLSQSSAARNALGIARSALCVKAGGFFELQTDQVVPSQLDAYSYNHDSTDAERRRLRPGWAAGAGVGRFIVCAALLVVGRVRVVRLLSGGVCIGAVRG